MRDFQTPGRSAVYATNGLCATSHPLASAVAIDCLKAGGNAMDAAIAGAVLLGLAEPQMTGIGGDCFVLVSEPGAPDVVAVNGSGRAPAAASAKALRAQGHKTVPLFGPEAVTIPGAMDAFCSLSDRWGKRGLADSLAPAIRYMEQGLPVAPRVARDWAQDHKKLRDTARRHYLPDGQVPEIGQMFRLPSQAEALRRIAKEGRAGFYQGPVMEDMLAALTELGGVHSAQDFQDTACTSHAPLCGHYKSRELLEHPPNGQGVTAHLMLNILSQFDLGSLDPLGAERAHLEAEATKLAYHARNRFLSDPDHMTRLDHMMSEETAQSLAALIDPARAMAAPAEVSEAVHKDTIYITVVDKDRMAVSLIYSIFHGFGSGIASEKYGILLQNRGAGFTLEAGHPNELAGGKRPMHTIIPAMVRDGGDLSLSFGVMGGQYQPTGHARVLSNLTDYGMDLQSALDAPRCFAVDGKLQVERGYAPEVAAKLSEMGHDVIEAPGPIGGAQAIEIRADGVLVGASDPRKDGCALGY